MSDLFKPHHINRWYRVSGSAVTKGPFSMILNNEGGDSSPVGYCLEAFLVFWEVQEPSAPFEASCRAQLPLCLGN